MKTKDQETCCESLWMSKLRFGTSGEIEFDEQQSIPKAECAAAVEESVSDVGEAVLKALAEPIEFPPLNRIVLPDDSVVIPLQPGLPCVADLVAGTVTGLLDVGVPPELIKILRTPYDSVTTRALLRSLDAAIASRLTVSEHDPADREHLSFLGASKSGHAIYVNREIGDAGFVLPIGFQGLSTNIYSSWFPAFSDSETQKRFHQAMTSSKIATVAKQLDECEEVCWMTGIQFVIDLVPAGDDRALSVMAGAPAAVWKRARERFESTWKLRVEEPVDLVLAGIGGGPEQQTWENVARTVDSLLDAVEVDGSIAICSQLKEKPGPALRRLGSAQDYESKQKAIRRTATLDAPAASRLNRALQRVRVYLLSELPESDIENLGMAFVSNPAEISKLSSRFERCLAIENAQHVAINRPTVD